MSEAGVVTSGAIGELDLESQAELVKEIKKNLASLKTSMDKILEDMNGIRNTRVEILERFDFVKNGNANTSAQIQHTLGKAKRIMKKSEENRFKLELLLKKMSDINVINSFTGIHDPDDLINGNNKTTAPIGVKTKPLHDHTNNNNGQEKIRLRLLDNNKYILTEVYHNQDSVGKEKSDLKWGRDSVLKELQWAVKMKLYKLRHHYERLSYDQALEERTLLPVCWGQGQTQAGPD